MPSYTDIKKGMIILLRGEPYEVLETSFVRMQQRKAVVKSKLKSLGSGKVIDQSWQASDEVEEADVAKREAVFLYTHRGEFWFHGKDDPTNRFALTEEIIGESAKFLKPQTTVTMVFLNDAPIKTLLPIKMDLTVVESPPAIRGNTAQGGTKQVALEGGARINVPLFVEEGDVVRVNTETGEYVERAGKTK
ncbi:MAG: elongation factor P [Candidatus Colwellbacteria bacterium]|nr:elongation factor P [Candidatus Colwellbacteria bacterium]